MFNVLQNNLVAVYIYKLQKSIFGHQVAEEWQNKLTDI